MTRALLLMSALLIAPFGQRADPPRLVAGSSIEQVATQSATYVYELDLRDGDLLDLTATQDQVIVKFTLIEPGGTIAHRFDLPQIHPLPDRLIFPAETTGIHRLEVYVDGINTRTPTPLEDPLTFTLTVKALGPATETDAERARIARTAAKAGELVGQQKLLAIEQSIPLFFEAADAWRRLGDRRSEATALRSVAYVTAFFTQFRVASADAWRRQTEIWPELGEPELEWESWHGLAVEYGDDGRVAPARDAGRQAMARSKMFADRKRYGGDVLLVATDELLLGNYEESRRLAGQAIEIASSLGDRPLEAMAVDILARLQALSGDAVAAVQQQARALDLAGESRVRRQLLMTLGFYQIQVGDLDAAENTFAESLALASRFVLREWDALTRTGLGDVAAARGDRERATAHYEEARAILSKSGFLVYRCVVENRVGRLGLSNGALDAARARFDEALAIALKIGSTSCESESRAGLAEAAFAAGDLDEAHTHALRVVTLTDSFREASVSVDARTYGFAALATAYERAVDLTMRLAARGDGDTRTAVALSLHERALARGLLDGLTAERLERRARVPPALELERRELRERWRAHVVELETALQRNAAERAAGLGGEIAVLAARLREVEARIDAANPRHASFVRPQPLDVEAMRGLLDEDTLLLEYGLGDERSYLWAVDRHGVRAFTLAPRAAIERAARRAHEYLARTSETIASSESESSQRGALRDLARLILDPVAPLLTKPRLVIVAPGALALVPFGALPAPSDARKAGGVEGPAPNERPLLSDHEIVSLPSATVLAALRALDAARPRPSKTAVVFADPVYERDDPRLSERSSSPTLTSAMRSIGPSAEPAEPPRGWPAASDGRRGVSLTRLPFSRREAAAIQRYAPVTPLSLVGLEATRERALAMSLADYRIVHFAAHGLVQTDVPNLSGIALSLVDRQRRAQNGFLMLPDVYDLTLNADLVVLSACQTALGNDVRGEGVIGLPRGFMYAGASRVISSLWRVDDEATAALMEAFYRRLLHDRLTPAAALRAAQLEVRATPRWRTPFYWAGFVLQGDWR